MSTKPGQLHADSPSSAATYLYDEQGNLASEELNSVWTDYTYDAANRLVTADVGRTGTPTTVYQWDTTHGWRTSQGPSDISQPLTYSYTATGRLASFSDSSTGHVVNASFTYDASGQRTQSDVTVNGTRTITDYSHEGITLLRLSAAQGENSWQLSYLYDEEGVPYAGVYRAPTSSTTPIVFGMVTTDRGDVVELLDTAGDPFAAYRYDPWGKPSTTATQATSLIGSSLAAEIGTRQVLRYASYVYDADIGTSTCGTYYLSARQYDPMTRQFISKDPQKADGEESAYQYCGAEPVGKVDPSGLWTSEPRRMYERFRSGSVDLMVDVEWTWNGYRIHVIHVAVWYSYSFRNRLCLRWSIQKGGYYYNFRGNPQACKRGYISYCGWAFRKWSLAFWQNIPIPKLLTLGHGSKGSVGGYFYIRGRYGNFVNRTWAVHT